MADVAVEGGLITAVESEHRGPIDTVIEADGRFLAPGFIDAHCHDDLELLRNPDRLEKIVQGVTCVVIGNCGLSLYPCNSMSRSAVRDHAAGLLGPLADEEIFDDFRAYRSRLEQQGVALHVVSLVGHGPLRLTAVGPDDRPATLDEQARMEVLLEVQLQQGAAGLSLGLVYPPSAYANREELIGLCKVAKKHCRPVAAHIRSYEAGLIPAIREFLALLRASGASGILSHLQSAGRPNWGQIPEALAILDEAVAEGIDISFDMYPYLAGCSYALQLLPLDVWSAGIGDLKQRLQDPTFCQDLCRRLESPQVGAGGWQSKVATIGWESILVAGVNAPSLKSIEGLTLAQAGEAARVAPFELLKRLILEDDGASSVVLFQLSEGDLRSAFTHSLHMVGSDGIPRATGRPHPRAFGTFPRVIATIVKKSHWLTLGEAVRRMTSTPAERFGLANRGRIHPGYFADLVLFNNDFRDQATFENPRRLAKGVSHVWVEGVPVLTYGSPAGNRPDRLLG